MCGGGAGRLLVFRGGASWFCVTPLWTQCRRYGTFPSHPHQSQYSDTTHYNRNLSCDMAVTCNEWPGQECVPRSSGW